MITNSIQKDTRKKEKRPKPFGHDCTHLLEYVQGIMERRKREALSICSLLLSVYWDTQRRGLALKKGLGQLGSWRGKGECGSYY